MRRIASIGILIVLALATVTVADNATELPLKIVSELWTLQGKDQAGNPKTIRILRVHLINTGTQPITVLTEKLQTQKLETEEKLQTVKLQMDQRGSIQHAETLPAQAEGEKDTIVTLGLTSVIKIQDGGHVLIPSLSIHAPVTLQPGEAAFVNTGSVDLSDYKSGKLKVGYSVSEFWGKRLSIWSGTVSSETQMKEQSTVSATIKLEIKPKKQ